MKILNQLSKKSNFIHFLHHLSRLSKSARQRSFLLREKKKLLLKLGEIAVRRVHEKKLPRDGLMPTLGQIEKLDKLIKEKDFGGKDGVKFRVKKKR